MWASILGIITTVLPSLLPLLIKAILAILDKSEKNKELKEEFLKFINSVEKDIPVKLNSKYNAQLERLREKLRQEQIAFSSIEDAYNNYRDGYEDIHKKYKELLDERQVNANSSTTSV